ncbi:hypothetical protein BT96DRAFT_67987 [Gymnopus androsaceus JB14]|uniref:Uncharacterized protein n=1 Tax=Gymnopus androsaceus JB14 TaxID=1447944 RepID=A0A6A4GCX2_9AGAR|nr:hypothetical protein BT96DRAFT_67987 [Gymnopus androsaceus JB14]
MLPSRLFCSHCKLMCFALFSFPLYAFTVDPDLLTRFPIPSLLLLSAIIISTVFKNKKSYSPPQLSVLDTQ